MNTPDRPAKQTFRRTLSQVRQLVPRGRRGRWVLLATLSVVAAGIEAISGLLIYGILELVQGGESRVGDLLERAVETVVPTASNTQAATVLTMVVVPVLYAIFYRAKAPTTQA